MKTIIITTNALFLVTIALCYCLTLFIAYQRGHQSGVEFLVSNSHGWQCEPMKWEGK